MTDAVVTPTDENAVFEEDIEAAVKVAVEVLGPLSRVEWVKENALENVVVESAELGNIGIWYGDTTTDQILELAKQLNMTLTWRRVN